MGDNKVKIQYGGHQVDATLIDVNQTSERWNEYFLEDGSVLKMKLVLTKVYRVDEQYDGDGNPVYVMQSTNVTAINCPQHLKRLDSTGGL